MGLLSRIFSLSKRQSPTINASSAAAGVGEEEHSSSLAADDPPVPTVRRPLTESSSGGVPDSPQPLATLSSAPRWKPDVELDRENRRKIIAELLDPGPYTSGEDKKISDALLVIDKLSDGKNPEITLAKHDMGTPLQEAYMCHNNENNITFGKVATTVHGASVLDISAYIFDWNSNFKGYHEPDRRVLKHCTLERINNHHQVWNYVFRSPPPLHNREFVWSIVFKRLSDEQCICVLQPTTHVDAPVTSDSVRATSTRIYQIRKMSESVTQVELFVTVDLKGLVPSWITYTIVIPTALRVNFALYFLQIKEYHEYDEAGEDAKMLGQMFMDFRRSLRSGKNKARDVELQTQFHRTAAFRYLFDVYPWLEAMLRSIVENKLRSTGARRGSVSASGRSTVITEADINVMTGKAFAFDLLSLVLIATPEDAAEQWVNERKNIVGIMNGPDPQFFQSFFTCVAQNLLLERSVGARIEAEAQRMFLEGGELKLDDATKDGTAPPPTPVDTSEKISASLHTMKTNFLAVIISIPALVLLYVIYEQVSERILEIGGMWGDHHAILCASCMISIEALQLFVWNFERGYVTRRLVQWPVTWLAFMLISKYAFDDRPDLWAVLLMSVAWAVGGMATWPLQPEPRPTFFKHATKAVFISAVFHGGFTIIVYGQIIPTRLLSHSSGLLCSFLTGIGFPFLNWIVRKVAIGFCASLTKGKVSKVPKDSQDANKERKELMAVFNRLVKVISSGLAITPCVLNYLNSNVKLAVLSAVLQMVTEVLGKIWIVYFTRKLYDPASSAMSGTTVDPEKIMECQEMLDQAMLLMAARWNAEIVAEKVGIILASFIAIELFGGGSDSAGLTTEQLILVAVIFFAMEFVTDVVFVLVMDQFLRVPILSKAINESGIFTKNVVQDSVIMTFMFVAMGSCIKMAVIIPLLALPGKKEM